MRISLRTLWVLLTVVAMTFAAMGPVGADQPPRPFKAAATGYATYLPDSNDPVTGGPCQHYGGLATLGFGNGTASHLGKVELSSAHCTPEGEEPVTGRMVLDAANGDRLVVEYVGPYAGDLGSNSFWGAYEATVVGEESTGRFHDAEGELDLKVSFTFVDFNDLIWPGGFELTGTIDY